MSRYPDVLLHIDGHWRPGRTESMLRVHDPASGEAIGRVAMAEREDLDDALAAAARGFETWRRIPAVERAKTMREAARLLRERAEGIARLLTLENGKPLAEALAEGRFDVANWRSRQLLEGCEVELEGGVGESISGRVVGHDGASGALILSVDGTERAILAGEVTKVVRIAIP